MHTHTYGHVPKCIYAYAHKDLYILKFYELFFFFFQC